MLQISKYKTKKQSYADKERGASNFIPYLCHFNENTILTKRKELLQVIKVTGFSFETADDEDVDIKKNLLNLLLKGFQTGGFVLYFHIIRRKITLNTDAVSSMDPCIQIPVSFSDYVTQEWEKKYSNQQSFVNELYVSVLKGSDSQGAAAVENFIKQFRASTDKTNWEKDIRDSYEELEEATGRVLSTLRDYGPELLSVEDTENGSYCRILEFLGKLVNCGTSAPMLVPNIPIDKYLPINRLYFGEKAIEVRCRDKNKVAGLVSIKEYGPTSHAGMTDSFLQMPFELIISQSFVFANRQVAIGQMQLQQNRMIQAEDKAVSQIAEINQALDMAMSGEIGFG